MEGICVIQGNKASGTNPSLVFGGDPTRDMNSLLSTYLSPRDRCFQWNRILLNIGFS